MTPPLHTIDIASFTAIDLRDLSAAQGTPIVERMQFVGSSLKGTDMKKTLFAIKNLFEREKSLKDYAWYIWF